MSTVPTEPEISSLDKLRQRVELGRRNLENPNVKIGMLKMWIGSVRYPLKQVFGENSPVLEAWPTASIQVPENLVRDKFVELVNRLTTLIEGITSSAQKALVPHSGNRVFIGHGRSLLWMKLKDFLEGRLSLPWEEFNRESTAGIATTARLETMLENATFAFLIMTAEDEHADATLHARENVVHEAGLFQGKLGLKRAIILKEDGCQVFSNLHGLTYIGFPKGNIGATFEEIRLVLEREGVIAS
jgi:Predicted nucleotide-binding protein containing TIR-like domain